MTLLSSMAAVENPEIMSWYTVVLAVPVPDFVLAVVSQHMEASCDLPTFSLDFIRERC